MAEDKDEGRCQGWRRHGGAFTLGPVQWEQCRERGTVMLTYIDRDHGEEKTMPACHRCWQECIDNGIAILRVRPIGAPEGTPGPGEAAYIVFGPSNAAREAWSKLDDMHRALWERMGEDFLRKVGWGKTKGKS